MSRPTQSQKGGGEVGAKAVRRVGQALKTKYSDLTSLSRETLLDKFLAKPVRVSFFLSSLFVVGELLVTELD